MVTAAGLGLAVVLSGCSINRTFAPDTYTVQRGDTLWAIAQHYDLDWHALARWNHIRPPYRIDVGERLTLNPYPRLNYADISDQRQAPASARQQAPAVHESTSSGTTHPLAQRSAPTVVRSANQAPAAIRTGSSGPMPTRQQVPAPEPKQPDDTASAEQHTIDSASASQATKQTTVTAGGPSADGWQWPASGSLLRAYDPSARRRGIELGGNVGSPIYAASSGTVVYNGIGLKGYGKLIIVKHDEHYLSAYGFNRKSLVEQGQTVAAGAHIANMGLGPGNKPMLHFEIRHDGDPIDPQTVLPKR
ncbi:peptidoglycan DD-metalloendopeptidase family protein [Salinisphaera sp. SPP-AMP-43]|uniref:peptidoglycan DD-metalloendopeptidase family protein n=1 Tax=Salinisphaera sp. SPP-AMP-43 TaxID=3121288 RepID=UPI003C6E717A